MEEYLAQAWSPHGQFFLLIGIAAITGLGKGGVPGLATVATALTVLTAPADVPGGLAYAVALQVPVLAVIDVAAGWIHRQALEWRSLRVLLPFSYAGMALGQVLDRRLVSSSGSEGASRLLVGGLLLFVLILRISVDHLTETRKRATANGKWTTTADTGLVVNDNNCDEQDQEEQLEEDEDELYAMLQTSSSSSSCSSTSLDSIHSMAEGLEAVVEKAPAPSSPSAAFSSASSCWRWFLTPEFAWGAAVGLIGGASTILTNSMGPILNVYLLAVQRLTPTSYVGTRAVFFCFINLGKLPLRVASGTLGWPMMPLAAVLGLVSVVGVVCAKPILLAIPERSFVRLELSVVAVAGARLCWTGWTQWTTTQSQ